MINYIWSLGLVVLSNVVYQICAKEVPEQMNPFSSLIITYSIGAILSFVFFCAFNKDSSIIQEFQKVNWAPFLLGFAIVGLEVGNIYAYKAGWPVSILQIVQASFVAVVLLFVGLMFYKETFTWNKAVGIIVCLVGLGLINLK